MEQREVQVKQKSVILYQRAPKQGNLLSARVFEGTAKGIDEAIKAIGQGTRAMLIVTRDVPDASNILQFCAKQELEGKVKLVQA